MKPLPSFHAPTTDEFFEWWCDARYVKRLFGHMREARRSNWHTSINIFWDLHVKPVIKGLRMDEITAEHGAAVVRRMQRAPNARGLPHAPANIHKAVKMMRTMLLDARDQGYPWPDGTVWKLEEVGSWRRLVLPRVIVKDREILTSDEAPAMMAAFMCLPHGGCLALILGLGLRAQEAYMLRWRHVILDAERYKPAAGILRYEGEDRKEGAFVEIPLPHELRRFLPPRGLKMDDPEFAKTRIWPFATSTRLNMELKKALDSVGIKKRITLMCLRHSAAVLLHEAGVQIEDIRDQLGHANIATTQIYLRSAHRPQRKAEIMAESARRMMMGV